MFFSFPHFSKTESKRWPAISSRPSRLLYWRRWILAPSRQTRVEGSHAHPPEVDRPIFSTPVGPQRLGPERGQGVKINTYCVRTLYDYGDMKNVDSIIMLPLSTLISVEVAHKKIRKDEKEKRYQHRDTAENVKGGSAFGANRPTPFYMRICLWHVMHTAYQRTDVRSPELVLHICYGITSASNDYKEVREFATCQV